MSIKRYPVKTKKIKKLLIDKELKIVDLARQIDENRVIVSHIIHGIRFVPRIRIKIAQVLEVYPGEIFPGMELKDAA